MERIKDIFPKAVTGLGIQGAYKRRNVLFHWRAIVGEDIARQSQPLDIERDTLVLAVSNSVWLHHLSMLKPDLVRQVNQFAGEVLVRDVRFRNQNAAAVTDPEAKPEANRAHALRQIRLSQSELAAADDLSAAVSDDLRARVSRVYRKELKLRKLRLAERWHECASCDALCPEDATHCSVCEVSARQSRKSEIRGILDEVPWATYAAICGQVECTTGEYIDAKTTLLARLAERVQHGQGGELEQKRLTMLFKGVSPDALSDDLVKETLKKFRRKTYVSTSGV